MVAEQPKTRGLVLKRNEKGTLCLHDEETGEMLAGQTQVQVTENVHEATSVTVTFLACRSRGAVKIQVDDDP